MRHQAQSPTSISLLCQGRDWGGDEPELGSSEKEIEAIMGLKPDSPFHLARSPSCPISRLAAVSLENGAIVPLGVPSEVYVQDLGGTSLKSDLKPGGEIGRILPSVAAFMLLLLGSLQPVLT